MNKGEKIKNIRYTLGLTMNELTAQLGINMALLDRVEKGYLEPNVELIYSICKLYGINTEYLMSDNDEIAMFAENHTYNNLSAFNER